MQDALRFVESCIDRYAELAWRSAYVMLSNAADADDLLQQAFMVAWRKADSAPRDNTWPWLATIIANEARNFRRKRARRRGVSLQSIGEPAMRNDPDQQLQRAELSALVHVSLAELGEEQRIAIVLTHLSGLSQSQAADALGLPLNTLKARVRRGLDSMRDALGKHAPGLEGTLKNLHVGAPPGGFIAAKAAWGASLATNVAAVGTVTAAGAAGVKAVLATAVAALVLTTGVLVAVAMQPKESPPPQVAAAMNTEPLVQAANKPATIVQTPAVDAGEAESNVARTTNAGQSTARLVAESVQPDPVVEAPGVATTDKTDPPEPPEEVEGLELAYATFERLLPLVLNSADEGSAEEVRNELTAGNTQTPWRMIGAIEAIRQGELDTLGSGKPFLDDVQALLEKKHWKLLENELLARNVLGCLSVLAAGDKSTVLDAAEKILNWYKRTKKISFQLEDHAGRALTSLTGIDASLDFETESQWNWWIELSRGGKSEDKLLKVWERSESSRKKPFCVSMRGSRVVFVIDLSDSMKLPVKDPSKLHLQLPHLDIHAGTSALDVVKAELCHSLEQLILTQDENKASKHRHSGNEEVQFAIVTYSTNASVITGGWVDATEKNCARWSRVIMDLEPEATTNVHDGLTQAFGVAEKRSENLPAELDISCTLTGADTIYLVLDGYANWSNDSVDSTERNEFGYPAGDGEYVKREKLLEFVARQNRFRKVVVHTIGLGTPDKELLRGLSKQSGGSFMDWAFR